MVNNPSANAGDIRHMGLIPELGKCPGGWHGHPLQYSCLENSIDRGAWWVQSRGFKESDTTKHIYTLQSQFPNRIEKMLNCCMFIYFLVISGSNALSAAYAAKLL